MSFIWHSIYGCPVCKDEDYNRVEGICDGGTRSVAFFRKSPCNGPDTRISENEKCNSEVKFPVAAVVVGVIAVVIVAIIAIVVFVKNRRLQHNYNLLQNSVNQRNFELDTVDFETSRVE